VSHSLKPRLDIVLSQPQTGIKCLHVASSQVTLNLVSPRSKVDSEIVNVRRENTGLLSTRARADTQVRAQITPTQERVSVRKQNVRYQFKDENNLASRMSNRFLFQIKVCLNIRGCRLFQVLQMS